MLVAVFQFTGCHCSSDDPELELPESSPGPGRPSPPPPPAAGNIPLTGDISIGPNVGVVVGDELSATYTGPEIVSYQWFKNGVAIPGATGVKYTPLEAGIYTVEVSAPGYISKNSPAVTVIIAPGSALFARSIATVGDISYFNGIALDGSGNAYAVGSLYGNASHDFGDGVTAKGVSAIGNSPLIVKYNSEGVAQWAQSVTAGGNSAVFYAVAVDPSGNVYAVGIQSDITPYEYGGWPVTGASASYNAMIVKYDPSGAVLWAKTPAPAVPSNRTSWFNGVAADASGAYVVGYQTGTGSFDYNGASTPLPGANTGSNAVLVKFRADGTGEWAHATSAGTDTSQFNAVALDSSGNIYAAGSQRGLTLYTYSGTSTQGYYAANLNAVLVKFRPDGTGEWARSTSPGSGVHSHFYGVAAYSTNEVYAVGEQGGPGTNTYSGIDVTSTHFSANALLVKYDKDGNGKWAICPSTGSAQSMFHGVAADASGVYTAGIQLGITSYTYGTVSISGSSSSENIVLLKLSNSGDVQWGRSSLTGSSGSAFKGVAVGASGVWAAGYLDRSVDYNFGNGVSLESGFNNVQILLVKYQK